MGDGGASWLRRAFKRAQEQAEREGVDIEVIAAQRWGSLEKFNQMLAKAEGRPVAPSKPAETRGEPHKRDERRDTRYGCLHNFLSFLFHNSQVFAVALGKLSTMQVK